MRSTPAGEGRPGEIHTAPWLHCPESEVINIHHPGNWPISLVMAPDSSLEAAPRVTAAPAACGWAPLPPTGENGASSPIASSSVAEGSVPVAPPPLPRSAPSLRASAIPLTAAACTHRVLQLGWDGPRAWGTCSHQHPPLTATCMLLPAHQSPGLCSHYSLAPSPPLHLHAAAGAPVSGNADAGGRVEDALGGRRVGGKCRAPLQGRGGGVSVRCQCLANEWAGGVGSSE